MRNRTAYGSGLLVLGLGLVVSAPSTASADPTTGEIDQRVDAALARFKEQVHGSEAYLDDAKGILVIPAAKKAAFIVGGQEGKGALRRGGQTAGYYQMTSGSIGFQAGYQEADFVFVFFTDDAVDRFLKAGELTFGMDFDATLVDQNVGLTVDSLKARGPVAVFGVGKKGLMLDWSLKGTKFTRIDVGRRETPAS